MTEETRVQMEVVQVMPVTPDELRAVVDRLLNAASPLYDEDASDDDARLAERTLMDILTEIVEEQAKKETEDLRNALDAMVENHHKRFPLSGRCKCDACTQAIKILGAKN